MRKVTLTDAISLMKRGEILIYPTETVYGLGVDATQTAAIESLFRFKQRDPAKPISILVASLDQILECTQSLSSRAIELIQKYFPGPLTLVLPASEFLSPLLHSESGWIGVRQSSHPIAQALVAGVGHPITTTSANFSGQVAASTLKDLDGYFSSREDVFLLSGGDLSPSRGSTVLRVEEETLTLLREGDLPFSLIESGKVY